MGILPEDHVNNDIEATAGFAHDNSSDIIDLYHAQDILVTSISHLALTKLIEQHTTTANTAFKYFPYMNPFQSHTLLPSTDVTNNIEEHKTRLQSTLTSWNFILEPVYPNGNCFFSSVALNLLHSKETNQNILELQLTNLLVL